jgi:nucleotide-binding universal stress UspA family protein
MERQPALLFATNFGAAARAARMHAELLARTLSLPMRLAYVGPAHAAICDEPVESGRAQLESLARELSGAGLTIAGADVLSGSAAEALIHHADATGCDWIVIGASGRRVGGTAHTMARFARQAVWVSRAPDAAPLVHVVCGIDGSAASRVAAIQAGALCHRWGATLELVSATADDEADHRQRLLAFVRQLELEVDAPLIVQRGSAREALLGIATTSHADLLVLGRVGLHGLRRTYLGGTAEHLLRHAPCSLLLTRPSEMRR